MEREKEGIVTKGAVEEPGVTVGKEGVNFSFLLPAEKYCRLNLYNRYTGRQLMSIRLIDEYRTGNVISVFLKNEQLIKLMDNLEDWLKSLGYLYETRQGELLDPCGTLVYGRENFGQIAPTRGKLFSGLSNTFYDWQGDSPIRRAFQDTILYKLHVRGFTMDESSVVTAPGTFLGLSEKSSYLSELGITACLLLPAYEFEESVIDKGVAEKINYWGYSAYNSFYAPKAAYAFDKDDPIKEFKDMVKSLHESGIEVLMEMNFIPGMNPIFALECLRFWVKEYHIDGFKLSNSALPVSVLSSDPLLGEVKFISEGWDYKIPPEKNKRFINYGECNLNFSNVSRRFLRGDEEQVRDYAALFTGLSEDFGSVKYITNHDGFTLWDLVSYDKKNNTANGENNRDGQDYNYSYNCGVEGNTNRNTILALRRKQVRNALTMLLLSQGTPMLLAGDEFLNSQGGNNNPYCQDNKISWLNWDKLENEKETLKWVQTLIQIRKEHPVFRRREPFRQMDYISCGMPDLSFHGTAPWYADYNHYSRQLGVLLCGSYAAKNRTSFDCNFYLAFNFHREDCEFYLPSPIKGEEWQLLLSTADNCPKGDISSYKSFILSAYSIKVFISRKV